MSKSKSLKGLENAEREDNERLKWLKLANRRSLDATQDTSRTKKASHILALAMERSRRKRAEVVEHYTPIDVLYANDDPRYLDEST